MKIRRFSIVVERDADGYFVFFPELQGCYSQGDIYEEALENAKDAVKLHLEDRINRRERLPKTESVGLSVVEVAV